MVEALLKAGAKVNDKSKTGRTALMNSVRHGHTKAVKRLLKAGADVNAQDSTRRTALMAAAAWGNTTAVRLLLAAGADFSASDVDGKTALSCATGQKSWATGHKQAATVKLLQRAEEAATHQQPEEEAEVAEPGM